MIYYLETLPSSSQKEVRNILYYMSKKPSKAKSHIDFLLWLEKKPNVTHNWKVITSSTWIQTQIRDFLDLEFIEAMRSDPQDVRFFLNFVCGCGNNNGTLSTKRKEQIFH